MATLARSITILILAVASLSHHCEGACHQNITEVVQMCTPGTLTGLSTFFVNANFSIGSNESCRCTVRQTLSGNIRMQAITGSSMSCNTQVRFYNNTKAFYELFCSVDYPYIGSVNADTEVAFNLTGAGTIDACISLEGQVQGTTLTVVCYEKIAIATTVAPSTMMPTTTTQTVPSSTSPTSQQPPSSSPVPPSSSPAPSSSSPVPPSSSPVPSSSPSVPPSSSPVPPSSSSVPPSSSPVPPSSSSVPPSSSPVPSSSSPVPPSSSPVSQSSSPVPSSSPSSSQPPESSSQPATTAQATQPPEPYRFPVAEVAGGVGAGIFVIILLVICVTCCTNRKRDRKRPEDQESLRARDSPEMQEKNQGRGYAFDNILYHASQRDLSGKSNTPPASDADPEDYTGTKGLEDLYASVKGRITESTDIM